jgi:hypothetical protein
MSSDHTEKVRMETELGLRADLNAYHAFVGRIISTNNKDAKVLRTVGVVPFTLHDG